jgi:hypothetical protein
MSDVKTRKENTMTEKHEKGSVEALVERLLRAIKLLETRLTHVEAHLASGEQRKSRFVARP